MQENIVCNVCGGTDFYNEAGYYYCNECQTQTQELREQVFDQQDNTFFLKTTKTTIRREKSFSQSKLASWEIFNNILYGLVEELETLGVNSNFKETCYHLWLMYLKQLEIMAKTDDGLPKLSMCYRKRDAEIIYKRSAKRKKVRKTSTSSAISSTNSSSNDLEIKAIRRERARQKRLLAKSEYDQYSSTNQSSDKSLLNQTLSSLGSSDDDASSTCSTIVFTKVARKKLLKLMTKEHLNKHINDSENKLKCHKFNTKLIKSCKEVEVCVLTRNKLYYVIYLALLLTEDKFQLSDIIRFCREGHLSYMQYKHFFPHIMTDTCIDESVYLKGFKHVFLHENARKTTWEIYKLLNLKKCDISPNLVKLCQRYCEELNLPDEICNMASNFIQETRPKFQTHEHTRSLPNYEARAMAFIIFAMKVLFGFDGATEYQLSNFARLINEQQMINPESSHSNMFVFDDWCNYIQYRKLILKHIHFPTKYLLEPDSNNSVELFVNFLNEKKMVYDLNEPVTLSMNVARKYLNDLDILQEKSLERCVIFKPSVTPFRSYIDHLKTFDNFQIHGVNIIYDMLKDRQKDSIDFLIKYSSYFKTIQSENCNIKKSGQNSNHKFIKFRQNINEIDPEILKRLEKSWHNRFESEKTEKLEFEQFLHKMLLKRIEQVTSSPGNEQNKNNKKSINNATPTRGHKLLPLHLIDKGAVKSKDKVGRDKFGRFCKLESEDAKRPHEFKRKSNSKWHVSYWRENPLLEECVHNTSLSYQVKIDELKKKKEKRKTCDKTIINLINDNNEPVTKDTSNGKESVVEIACNKNNKNEKYPYHYVPWLEYWINVISINSHMTSEKWDQYFSTLPKNFQWLLKECSTIIEQKPQDLFAEFVNVELYMCYIHLKNTPIANKPYGNSSDIVRLIKRVKSNW